MDDRRPHDHRVRLCGGCRMAGAEHAISVRRTDRPRRLWRTSSYRGQAHPDVRPSPEQRDLAFERRVSTVGPLESRCDVITIATGLPGPAISVRKG